MKRQNGLIFEISGVCALGLNFLGSYSSIPSYIVGPPDSVFPSVRWDGNETSGERVRH